MDSIDGHPYYVEVRYLNFERKCHEHLYNSMENRNKKAE